MTYSWTLLAPSGHWEYTKQMQTGQEEGGGGEGERGGGGGGGGGTQMEGWKHFKQDKC